MSREMYLLIAILVLFALGALALGLFLLLRRGPKVEHKKCAGCDELTCPLARKREE